MVESALLERAAGSSQNARITGEALQRSEIAPAQSQAVNEIGRTRLMLCRYSFEEVTAVSGDLLECLH
jgi:hypothetical protein